MTRWNTVIGSCAALALGAFAEIYGDVPTDSDLDPRRLVDGGVTCAVQGNLQLDLALGIGLSARAEDWFMGMGVSHRMGR